MITKENLIGAYFIDNDRQNIEKFNKKAIYLLVREMTNCETQFITRVVNNIKREYLRLYQLFEDGRFA